MAFLLGWGNPFSELGHQWNQNRALKGYLGQHQALVDPELGHSFQQLRAPPGFARSRGTCSHQGRHKGLDLAEDYRRYCEHD